MKPQTFITNMTVALGGVVLTGGAYWALLNVPESNVLALALSLLLVILIVIILGLTTATVAGQAGGRSLREALPWAVRRLPMFVLGVVVFAAVWWVTTFIEGQWSLHSGEIDALCLRYAGTSNTAWLFTTVTWVLWLVRWGLGLAAVGALTVGSPRLVVAGRTLGATVLALLVAWGLSFGVYWRPRALPADSAEVLFALVKFGVLAAAGAALVVGVLSVFARESATTRA